MAQPPRKSRSAPAVPFTLLPGSGVHDEDVELGSVSGVFGVVGEVRLFLHHRESDLLSKGAPVILVSPDGRRYGTHLMTRSGAGNRVLGKFSEPLQREQAASLKDWKIVVPKADLPEVEDDEFYVWQLEGADVEVDGEIVGQVVAVHHTGGIDVLEIDVGADPVFIPCLHALIERLDVEEGLVVLDAEALE